LRTPSWNKPIKSSHRCEDADRKLATAKSDADAKKTAVDDASKKHEAARKAAATAITKMTGLVRQKLLSTLEKRDKAVNEYSIQLDLIAKAQAK
jgi:hypothetical protein